MIDIYVCTYARARLDYAEQILFYPSESAYAWTFYLYLRCTKCKRFVRQLPMKQISKMEVKPFTSSFKYLSRSLRPQSTYICRVQSCVSRLPKYWPPTPLSTQRVCPLPAPKAGGTHSPGVEGGGGSVFWETRDIGLASYSNNLSTHETVFKEKQGVWYPMLELTMTRLIS